MGKNQPSILVVGGAGYIGSHMVKQLTASGYHVLVLDDLSTGFRRLVGDDVTFVQGSLADTRLVDRILTEHPFTAVMHFAAFSHVRESVHQPLKYYANNIGATIALIQAMARRDVKNLIYSSTASVYGAPMANPIDENHPCRPVSPYGETKRCIEQLLAHCDAAYGLKSVCLRYFNAAGADPDGTIGEMHRPETHLIPLVLQSARHGKPLHLFGTDHPTPDGTCIRDYVHVADLAHGHLLCMEHLLNSKTSRIYNLGNSTGYSVRQVIDTAERITGRKIEVIEAGRRAGDPPAIVADASRIRRELGWHPRFETLAAIIETAWRWERNNPGCAG